MPMPAEYHEGHGNHENANFALGSTQDANNMTANMYRVGDYVYFETTTSSPYQIRRIEELNKTANGNVEAKVMCFFRRRDLPPTLVMLADKHQWMEEGVPGGVTELSSKQRHQMKHRELFLSRQVETMPATHIRGKCCVTLLNETESLTSYLNKEDSFFYCLVFDPAQRTLLADKGEIRVGSRYQATDIPAVLTHAERDADTRKLQDLETLIWTPRHNMTDRQIDQFLVVSRSVGTFARALDCSSSIKQPSLHMSAAAASRDITLFHAMDTLHLHAYDLSNALASLVPSTGPVLCRDEMEEWSASEANLFEEALEKYGKDFADIRADFLPWKTLKNVIEYYYMWKTTDRYVQQKRVKAVEAESKLKQVYIPNYNKTPASTTAPSTATIVPLGNSNSNSNGKPTSVLNGNSNGSMVGDNSGILMVGVGGKPCESCQVVQSPQWYAWGPSHMQYRLCQPCWTYWKKYGGLKVPSRIDDVDLERKRAGAGSDEESKGMGGAHRPHRCSIPTCGKEFKLKAHLSRHYASAHGVDLRGAAGSGGGGGGSPRPVMKTRSAFYLRTSLLARAARRLCAAQLRTRHAARAPHQPVNAAPLRHLCAQLASKTPTELRILARAVRPRPRPQVIDIASRLGDHPSPRQPGDWDWLTLTAPAQRKQPDRVSFPRPPKAPDGSLLYERVPNKPEVDRLTLTPPQPQPVMSTQQNILKRPRPFDEINGSDGIALNAGLPSAGPPTKRHHSQQLHPKHTLEHPPPAVLPLAPPLNGRASHPHSLPHGPPLSRSNARKQVMSWMDAPDDVYFRATEQIKRARRNLASMELRRAARKPWRRMSLPLNPLHLQRAGRQDDMVVILD
ncbi:PREDICTED: metastasis-associated protein MTA3 isoform X2 [Wasmannia auropunctata]|uniref:metastasis-associated protein MTA3 isoform X2 n=1 Tax=Wasmannia auropunctata TaxID=64793 RepID=UPI0005EF5241|nr:PREDICTED: metastasis-associated protein MTA3 isoform X2 [Wasmannia auropunctata]